MKKINTAAINVQQVNQNQQKSNTKGKSKSQDNGFSDMMNFALVEGEEPNTATESSTEGSFGQNGNTLIQENVILNQMDEVLSRQGLNLAKQNEDSLQALNVIGDTIEDNNLEEYLDDFYASPSLFQVQFNTIEKSNKVEIATDNFRTSKIGDKLLHISAVDDKLQNIVSDLEDIEGYLKSQGQADNNNLTSIKDLKNSVQDILKGMNSDVKVDVNNLETEIKNLIAKLNNNGGDKSIHLESKQELSLSSLEALSGTRNLDVFTEVEEASISENLDSKTVNTILGSAENTGKQINYSKDDMPEAVKNTIASNELEAKSMETEAIKNKLQNILKEVQDIKGILKVSYPEKKEAESGVNLTTIQDEQELSFKNLARINRNLDIKVSSTDDNTKKESINNSSEVMKSILGEQNKISDSVVTQNDNVNDAFKVQTGIESEETSNDPLILNTNVQSTNTNFTETNITTESGIQIENLDEVMKEFEVQTQVIKNNEELTMKAKLKPVELGELSIQIEKKDNSIVARIIVESNETKEIIQKNIHLINDSLGDKDVKIIGIDVEDKSSFTNNFSFNSQGENSNKNNFLYDEESGNSSRTSGENVEEAYESENNNSSEKTLNANSTGNVNILI